jgi:hypothetical protein
MVPVLLIVEVICLVHVNTGGNAQFEEYQLYDCMFEWLARRSVMFSMPAEEQPDCRWSVARKVTSTTSKLQVELEALNNLVGHSAESDVCELGIRQGGALSLRAVLRVNFEN